MVTIKWRVYGAEGHRQRDSFDTSETYVFGKTTVHFSRQDETGTNDYSEVTITAETEKEARREFEAQLMDGAFECCRVGRIDKIGQ